MGFCHTFATGREPQTLGQHPRPEQRLENLGRAALPGNIEERGGGAGWPAVRAVSVTGEGQPAERNLPSLQCQGSNPP